MVDATGQMLPALATWTRSDAYGWALGQRAKAFRLLDRPPDVLEAVAIGLSALQGDEAVCAHLHLEAGMALNQFGMKREAARHLRAADRVSPWLGTLAGGRGLWCRWQRRWAIWTEAVVRGAIGLAISVGDELAATRGSKQPSSILRYQRRIPEALDAITTSL